jgi:hypothetical protein
MQTREAVRLFAHAELVFGSVGSVFSAIPVVRSIEALRRLGQGGAGPDAVALG